MILNNVVRHGNLSNNIEIEKSDKNNKISKALVRS